ncbi:hypothetical protein ACIQYG_03180 [Peribacillus sp. NPDC096622]|uniref:hypothetical protein n=1 Tax=Peribacillus sp. NPDC096622 TaxID=3364396 RepID=UPI00382D6CF5
MRSPLERFSKQHPLQINFVCDTPAEKLAGRDTAGACFDAAWQTAGGKGADFCNRLEHFSNKN